MPRQRKAVCWANLLMLGAILLLGLSISVTKVLAEISKADQELINRVGGLMTSYYLYPQPERIPELIQNIGMLRQAVNGRSDPMTGFLAGLFRQHPDKVEGWIKRRSAGNDYDEMVLLNAVWLAGLRDLVPPTMNEFGWPAERMRIAKSNLALIPDLASYVIRIPADQDLLWSAYFASGESLYIQKILEAYIEMAQSPDMRLDDIALMVTSQSDPTKQSQMKERLQHYSQEGQRRLATAAAALWSLGSNAAQHGRVHQLLAQYVRQHERDPATRVLARQVAVAGHKVMRGGFTGPVQVMLMMTQDPKFLDTQVPEFLKKDGHPVVPDRVFDFSQPVFVAIMAMIKAPTQTRVEIEVVAPDGRQFHCKPAVLPSGEVKQEASISTTLVPIELDEASLPGLYLAQVTVRSMEGPSIFFGINFLMEKVGQLSLPAVRGS